MIVLALMLAAAIPAPVDDPCEVGRAAMRDVPALNGNPRFDTYFDAADPILQRCPQLRSEIPAGFPLSDLDARTRANEHVPRSDHPIRPAFIYFVGLPLFSADGLTATFSMGCTCTGLCGTSYTGRYVKTPQGWRRDGEIRVTAVS